MKTKCMALKNIVDHEECLKCAATGENPCSYDYSLLKYIFSNTQERPDIHVTDLCGCLRRAYLGKKIEVATYPHEKLMLALGQVTHGLLEGASDSIVTTEIPVEAFGIVGKADKIQEVEGGFDLIDYKTTRWLKPGYLPYGSHEQQINIYAVMLKKIGYNIRRAFVQYIDMSGPTKCRSCKVPVAPEPNGLSCPKCGNVPSGAHLGALLCEIELRPEGEVIAEIEERRDTLMLAMEMGSPPPSEPSFLCNYCAYSGTEHCQEGGSE